MVRAFPRGRTTEELLVLVGAGFSHDKRLAAIAELDQLLRDGLVEKAHDGRWRAKRMNFAADARSAARAGLHNDADTETLIHAAAATFVSAPLPVEQFDAENAREESIDAQALLRYWRSALRADPRGAITQVLDKHGIEWSLISGQGPIDPGENRFMRISIDLAAIDPAFQEALVRREGHENALAVGWPMAVGRRGGVPIFQPVGMFAAAWKREAETLVLTVDADDVLVNPEWVRSAARASGWNRGDLADLFSADDGLGLRTDDFVEKVRGAVASQIRGSVVGEDLASQLDSSAQGIYDSAAIFLPTDSSFTAGAARDLDTIATWPRERIARTALGEVLGIDGADDADPVAAIDAVPLNKEQLRAVRGACEAPLTVVTGPPGTGKSQAIVSMAASMLAAGGSVLVASKNHQALDAVEDRLGSLAPNVPFSVRTLNPTDETDMGFSDVLKKLIEDESGSRSPPVDELALAKLIDTARRRTEAVDTMDRIAELECDIPDVLERIDLHEAHGREEGSEIPSRAVSAGILRRLVSWLRSVFTNRTAREESPIPDARERRGMGLADLCKTLAALRSARERLGDPEDPIEMGERIREATGPTSTRDPVGPVPPVGGRPAGNIRNLRRLDVQRRQGTSAVRAVEGPHELPAPMACIDPRYSSAHSPRRRPVRCRDLRRGEPVRYRHGDPALRPRETSRGRGGRPAAVLHRPTRPGPGSQPHAGPGAAGFQDGAVRAEPSVPFRFRIACSERPQDHAAPSIQIGRTDRRLHQRDLLWRSAADLA